MRPASGNQDSGWQIVGKWPITHERALARRGEGAHTSRGLPLLIEAGLYSIELRLGISLATIDGHYLSMR